MSDNKRWGITDTCKFDGRPGFSKKISRKLLTQGLRLVSDHPGLLFLRDLVTRRIASTGSADEALAKVSRLEEQEQWEEAAHQIETGLEAVPGHPELISTKQRIEEGWLRSLTEEVENLCTEAPQTLNVGVLASCQRLIQEGLDFFPGADVLVAFRTRVEEQKSRMENAAVLLDPAREAHRHGELDLDEASRPRSVVGLRFRSI